MFKNPKLKKVFLAGFLLAFHLASTAYINSSFLASFLRENSIGLVFTFGSLASIAALLFMPEVLRRMGNYKFLLYSVAGSALALLSLSIFKNAWIVIPIFIFYLAVNNLIIFIIDELLEIFSEGTKIGKMRGFYIALTYVAWVLAQIFSGKILNSFSFRVLYFVVFEIMVAMFLICFFYLRNLPDPKYDRSQMLNTLKKFFKNSKLTHAYLLNFLLQFFYSWMVIYTPIYLNAHLGFTWQEITTIFLVMLLPFIFMPIPLGKYSDKFGEKKMLTFGFSIISIATLILFFLTVHKVWLWALLLFLTRIGASTIDTMTDVYFFKHISPENDEFIGVYRNTSSLAYIIGPLLASILLAVLPSFNYLYLILAAIMSSGIYLATKITRSDI
jgi:MFS family permease